MQALHSPGARNIEISLGRRGYIMQKLPLRATLLACCMKALLHCFALLALPLVSLAQSASQFIPADSVKRGYSLKAGWLYHDGDNSAWTGRHYNDNGWAPANSTIVSFGKRKQPFSGIGWFRKRISIDSTLTGKALALTVSHDGASEIFLDGKLLTRNGVIAGDSTESFDPNKFPFVFVIDDTGEHVLAVRYADPDAAEDWGMSKNIEEVGFSAKLWFANDAVANTNERNMFSSVSLISLASIFATIALLHLILFLYHRSERSNGLFALFAFCLSASFLISFLASQPIGSTATTVANWALTYLIILSAISLSGFINALFGKSKWRFRALLGAGVLVGILVPFTDEVVSMLLVITLAFFALLEMIILVIGAVSRRVPGARIIAFGVLSFPAFIMAILVAVLVTGGSNTTFTGVAGVIVGLGLLGAILAIPVSMSAYLAWSYTTVNKRLKAELLQVEALSEKTRRQEEEKQRLLENRQQELTREVAIRTEQLRGEKQKSDELLLNILPEEVAEELKERGYAQARLHNDVTVLFTDFVDFTRYSESLSPAKIVEELDACFKDFDAIIERHGLEKIKTIGDAYMAVAGLPAQHPDGPAATVTAALEILEYIHQRRRERPESFDIRIGVHSGPVVAGIIGVKKFAYDVWGDTVNTAARMEQSGVPGKVNISATTYSLVKDRFMCTYRGEVAAKGKGVMAMYFVEGEVSSAEIFQPSNDVQLER